MRIEASTVIARRVEAVWALVADPTTYPQWDPGTLEVRQTSTSPIGKGTTLVAVVDLLGRRELGVRIMTFEPSRELQFEFTSGLLAGTGTRYAVEPLDDRRTRLTRASELHLNGWWRLLWPLAAWSATRGRANEVSNVKRILGA